MYDIKELGPMAPPYGGVSVYIKRLVEQLTKDGLTVGGYYTTKSKPDVKHPELFDEWTWFETKSFPWKIFKFHKQIKRFKIIHSHMSLEAMVYLWAFKNIFRKKVIITIHNSMVGNYYVESNFINTFFLQRMAMDKNVIWIAVSKEGKEQMLKLPVTFKSEINVIPAYIPDNPVRKELKADLRHYMESHTRNLVFYGHSFMSNRGDDVYGFREMIDIYHSLNRNELHLGLVYCIADVSDKQSVDNLVHYAKEKDVYDDIYWQYGGINNMLTVWERTDVYVRPTSTDGDSLSVREALEAGAQVVASNVVKRPDGCLVYKQGDIDDARLMICKALLIPKQNQNLDYTFYSQMKSIYMNAL